jgi:hypothetical protein
MASSIEIQMAFDDLKRGLLGASRAMLEVQRAIEYDVEAIGRRLRRNQSAEIGPVEIWRLPYNRYHRRFKELVKVSREHWDHTSTFQVQRIYNETPERAQELADRKLAELAEEAQNVRQLMLDAQDAEDEAVFTAWLNDISEYEMLVRAALPGGIAC